MGSGQEQGHNLDAKFVIVTFSKGPRLGFSQELRIIEVNVRTKAIEWTRVPKTEPGDYT